MFTQSKDFRRLSGTAFLAAISLFLLAGCGGGGGNGNSGGGGATGTGTTGTGTSGTGTGTTSGSSLYAGSYQGVYLNTSGAYSPDAGTITFTVASNGAISGSDFDLTGDGSTNSFTGTVSSSGALVTNAVTGTLSQNTTTHVFSTSYTESNGTKGVLSVGLAPTASPLAGSYSGTFSSTGGGQGTVTLTISSGGAVAGTAIQQGDSGTISGYVDKGGIIYIANFSNNTPQNSIGTLTLNGSSLKGVLANSGTDGSNYKVTVSLTRQ
jgi:hypothetical protein